MEAGEVPDEMMISSSLLIASLHPPFLFEFEIRIMPQSN